MMMSGVCVCVMLCAECARERNAVLSFRPILGTAIAEHLQKYLVRCFKVKLTSFQVIGRFLGIEGTDTVPSVP